MVVADNYSVIFRGDIVFGKNIADVKQKLSQLFKVSDARIERMFTGKPVHLKTNIALAQSKKYQRVLRQAGIITEIIEASATVDAAPSKTSSKTPANQGTLKASEKPSATEPKVEAGVNFSLAPVGSELFDDEPKELPPAVVVDHISLAEHRGNIIEDDERLTPLPTMVDVESLDWDITEVGDILLKPSEYKQVEVSDVNTDNISLADTGGELLKADEKKVTQSVDIDTHHIKLLPSNGLLGD